MRIAVYGSFEAAHRLTATPGTCSQIHGHSWKVRLELTGPLDNYGMVRDFRDVKALFREYLKEVWDHRLVLNANDRVAGYDLPGLITVPGEPTTENIALWIGRWAQDQWENEVSIRVRETEYNEALWP